ncbi:hypothetical protein KJ853_03260 [Patescibacteria group bacterium]|nr:hypothetical protein [Patescibacteria group bacterium]
MEAEQISKFERVFEFREILQEAVRSPFRCFEKWPILEVWEKCLKAIGERGVIYKEEADWAEKWIHTLLEQSVVSRDIGKKLLSWYVFTARGKLAVRAVEFALGLRQGLKVWPDELSKLIAGRLIKNVSNEGFFYPQLPSLKKFLHELLDEFKKERRDGYLDSTWYCAERALRIIVAAEDFSFLDKIEEVILLMQAGQIFPSESSEPFYFKVSNLGAFKEAKKILVRARKEHIIKSPEV